MTTELSPSPVAVAPARRAPIRARNPALTFDAAMPRHWFGGNAVATHMVNGVNLLFPAGERFFVRSVRRFLDRIADDPALVEQVRGFAGQEGRHAQAHERFFETLEAQGYDTKRFLRVYEAIDYGVVERIAPAQLSLAATAAAEHFTAIMAENVLVADVFAEADPALRKLLLWHAAEEIEHKSVAFDVLARVNPSYALRMAGLALAGTMLATFWIGGALTLLAQDGISPLSVARTLAKAERQPFSDHVFGRAIREYARRGFHPSQNDNYALARAFLASAGLA
jgi:predicted metal-dependent hydrolase